MACAEISLKASSATRCWIVTYPVNKVIQFLNTWALNFSRNISFARKRGNIVAKTFYPIFSQKCVLVCAGGI